MRIEALMLRARPRRPLEAADLGVRLCQRSAGSVYLCYGAVGLPLAALALTTFQMAVWLPGLVLWCAKPWLDRTVLFVLSRAAFGQPTELSDLWQARRSVWWRHFWHTWTLRRLSPWRSFTQPVYQLEGSSIRRARERVRQLRHISGGAALLMTSAFSVAETSLTLAVISLAFWFAPPDQRLSLGALLAGKLSVFAALVPQIAYAMVVLFLEPFFVASGFAMYLNRRSELEAWDIEQELRRAFAL